MFYVNKTVFLKSYQFVCDLRTKIMANNDQTFSYRLVKISLIILNALVVVGLTFSLLLIGHHFDTSVVVFVLIIGKNIEIIVH